MIHICRMYTRDELSVAETGFWRVLGQNCSACQQVRSSGMQEKVPLKTFPLWGDMYLHSQQFQMIRNRWIKRQISWQRTERALVFFFFSSFPEERLVHFCRKRLFHRWSLNLNGSQFFSYIFYIRKVSYFCFSFSEYCAPLSTGSEEASGPRITFSSSYTNKRARSQATILTAVSQDLYTCINYTGTMFRYHV